MSSIPPTRERHASEVTLDAAAPGDAPAIAALLRAAELPAEDFAPHLAHFVVARRADRVVGAVGAEASGPDALLRSLVVAPEERGRGLGGRLVNELDRRAVAWGIERWWLLTTTAKDFFIARGFAVASRGSAPAGIQSTGQFSGGCCRCAVCLSRPTRELGA